jgi:hypothetical protein
MIEEVDVARLMRAEVELAEEPSAVLNIERAMTAGRRQRRYARGAAAGLAVAALAVGAVTVPSLVGPDRPSGSSMEMVGALAPLEPYTGKVPLPDSSRLPAVLKTVDPTVQYVRFGWLPAGLDGAQYQAGLLLSGTGVSLIGPAAGSPNPNWSGVAVGLYPAGVTPPAPQVVGVDARAPIVSTVSAPDVRGSAATFTQYDVDGTDQLCLRWRYAPDGWAEVRVAPWASGQDAREIALHMAQKLVLSTTERTQLPSQVTGLAQNLHPILTEVSGPLTPGSRQWYASVTYSAEVSNTDPEMQRAKTLQVSFSPDFQTNGKSQAELLSKEPLPPNTTIDGHQAYFTRGGDPDWLESLSVYDVQGLTVRIDGARGTVDKQGTKGVFQRLDLASVTPDWRPALVVN